MSEEILNQHKDKLSGPNYQKVKQNDPWERSMSDLIRSLKRTVDDNYITKAWVKMYEMLVYYKYNDRPLVEFLVSQGGIHGFFNAELPGGFIFAVNQYCKQHGIPFDWVISSYYPQDKQGDYLGDKFNLFETYKGTKHILMGDIKVKYLRSSDSTVMEKTYWSDGNLMNLVTPNQLSLLAKSMLRPLNLYTADGGFDVTGKENQQEILSSPLIKGEIECGLRSLSPGGVMIIKIFTFFTPQMQSLLILTAQCFDNWNIYKPNSSGFLNSESYFIGIGFKGIDNNTLQILQQDITNPSTVYVNWDTVTQYKRFIDDKLSQLVNTQITRIINFLDGTSNDQVALQFDVRKLTESEKLVPKK